MKTLREKELEEVRGGLNWGMGFLAFMNPVGVLAVSAAALVGLVSNYSSYKEGVSAGYDAASNS